MRRILIAFVAFGILCSSLSAQPPETLTRRGVIRSWTDASNKPLLSRGEYLETSSGAVSFKDHDTGRTVAHKLADLSPGDVHYIRHWTAPAKRDALRKFAANVICGPDGAITLALSQSGCTDADLKFVAALPETVSINLFECPITDDGLVALKSLPNLKDLSLELTRVKGPGFEHLAALATLERLSYSPEDSETPLAPHLRLLTPLKRLKSLTLILANVGAEGLKSIDSLPQLESLELLACPVDSPALGALKPLTGLKKLALSDGRIDDADARTIGSLTELRELHLSAAKLTPEGLKQIARLEKLEHLSAPETLADGDLRLLGGLSNLKTLRLSSQITDAGMAHLRPLKNLETLTIPPAVTAKGLKHLEGMTSLKRLDFQGDRITFSQAMSLLVDGQKRSVPDAARVLLGFAEGQKIEHLSLAHRVRGDRESLKYLAHFPDLKGVSLPNHADDDWLSGVAAAKKLEVVQFNGGRFSDKGFKALAACPNLERLEFRDTNLEYGALTSIAALPKLKSLHCMNTLFFEGDNHAFEEMTNLQSLYFNANLHDWDLSYIGRLEKLEFLSLPEGVTGDGLAHLRYAKNLRVLQLPWQNFTFSSVRDYALSRVRSGNRFVSRDPVDVLGIMTASRKTPDGKLKRLNWPRDLAATADDLKILRQLTDVEWMGLPRNLTDAGLEHIKNLATLKTLHLESKEITDAGLVHLSGLKNLEVLSITDAPITDAGLRPLHGLTNLTSIDLAGSRVTDAGIATLQKALPLASIRK